MLDESETAKRLGVSRLTLETIKALVEVGFNYRVSQTTGVKVRTLRMRLSRARRDLGVRNNVCLCLLVDRVQHGLSNAEAMKGLS